jgi:hypothetical protein
VLGVVPNFKLILTRNSKPFGAAFGKLSDDLIKKIAGFLTSDPQDELLVRRLNELEDGHKITWSEFLVELSYLHSLLCHGPDIFLANEYQLIRNNRRGPFQNPHQNRRLVTIEAFFELRPTARVTYNTTHGAPGTAERVLNRPFAERQMTCHGDQTPDQRAAGASSVATSPSGEVTAPLGPPGGVSSSGAPPWINVLQALLLLLHHRAVK